jgi:hypothetical protein
VGDANREEVLAWLVEVASELLSSSAVGTFCRALRCL